MFVTHGGMNSVMESLYNEVPMVVIPQMSEQRANALRVAELGLGIQLNRDTVDTHSLRATVDQIATDTTIRERVTSMSQESQMRSVDAFLTRSR